MTSESIEECMWCKARLPAVDGSTHPYMQSTPSCWACFGEVLAKEYSAQTLQETYRLTADAYAVQHPGVPSRQSIQSVGVHLVRLCLFIEHALAPEAANDAMLAAARHKARYIWLEPPASLGALTVADIAKAPTQEAHKALVRQWAAQMWDVWSPHHDTVRKWAVAG